jgi:ATP/maltotriose-dependent transcriptional regulator MalT
MSIFPRDRLTRSLYDSANRGIALVVASPGYGKTEAIADACGEQAHWVRLTAPLTLEALARDVIAAAAPHAKRSLKPLLGRAINDENRAHLASWVAARLRTVRDPIVVDDVHHLTDRTTLAFLREIVEATIPHVRWVLASREMPDLPIGTWLARDWMALPIIDADLAFDGEEAAGLAGAMRLPIPAHALASLVHDVQGWPLAVRLSLDAWSRTGTAPALRVRTRSVLFAFLETEVWSQLTADECAFLEVAAHLKDLRAPVLSAAGVADARDVLERLGRRLPLLAPQGDGAYRLHDLFADFVIERVAADATKHQAIVRSVAGALEAVAEPTDSIATYARIGDWETVLVLLSHHGIAALENGRRSEIVDLLARIPGTHRDHPVVSGLRACGLAIDGAYDAAIRDFEAALRGPLDSAFRGALLFRLGIAAYNRGHLDDGIRILEEVYSHACYPDDQRVRSAGLLAIYHAIADRPREARVYLDGAIAGLANCTAELRAMQLFSIAYAAYTLCDYDLAESYATECVQLAQALGLDLTTARGYSVLLNVSMHSKIDIRLARAQSEACLRFATASGDRPLQHFALNSLLVVASMQGDDELFATVRDGLAGFKTRIHQISSAWYAFSAAAIVGGRGDLNAAIDVVRVATCTDPAEAAFQRAVCRLLLAAIDPAAAESSPQRPLLATAPTRFEARHYMAYAHAFHALAEWLCGRGRTARRMPIASHHDLNPADGVLLGVIATICATSRQTVTARQIEQLTEPLLAVGFDGYARFLRVVLKPATISPLTRMELDTLREVRRGGTTGEIAERMGRSSNTVLSHVKSACAKIGCSGRAAAVAYALDQGWID